jgi:hypothetical protein
LRRHGPELCNLRDDDCDAGTRDEYLVTLDDGRTFGELHEALAAAAEGAVLSVCPGVYEGLVTEESAGLEIRRSLTVEGLGDAGDILLRGEMDALIVYGPDPSMTVVLRNLTIENRVVVSDVASFLLEDVTISGRALEVYSSFVTMDHGRIHDSVEAGLSALESEVVLRSVVIEDNTSGSAAFGGGAAIDTSTVVADEETVLRGNYGTFGGGASVTFGSWTGGWFLGNSARDGGGIYAYESRIEGVGLEAGSAERGGGIFLDQGSTASSLYVVTNTAFVGGGAYVRHADLTSSYVFLLGNFANANGGNLYLENSTFRTRVSSTWLDGWYGGVALGVGNTVALDPTSVLDVERAEWSVDHGVDGFCSAEVCIVDPDTNAPWTGGTTPPCTTVTGVGSLACDASGCLAADGASAE